MPSTVIRRWDYDAAERRLDVTFVSGKLYSYLGVPEDEIEAMRRAVSKGSFFNCHIRDHYPFVKRR